MRYPTRCLAVLFSGFAVALAVPAEGEDDNSVEGLYQTASEQSMSGDHAAASATFEKLISLSGGKETLFEDYGAQAGGFYFDYAMTLLPQGRWEEAKEALEICLSADDIAKEVQSPMKSENARKNLARFQLGFCEAQMGNHEEALKLYDEYMNSDPPADELQQIFSSFKLRYGTSLMKLGRTEEGIATIQELFDSRESRRIAPQFLMQGVLELGLSWVEQANAPGVDEAALERISETAHEFIDRNQEVIAVSPLDQYRFGFVERLRRLGFESTRAGLYSVALRYFAFMPTLADVKKDIDLALGRLPIGSGIPSQYQQLIDRIEEQEKAPFHPDAETLRLVASCYERLGNLRAARVVNWHLSEQFPDIAENARAEILHEASRLSSLLADYPAAQYFGEKFMAESSDEHPLRNNVSTFMLQSLFTSGDYAQVAAISERVRERFEPGDAERELADSLYPLALYSQQQHEEASEIFSEYVKNYPDGANAEIVRFHRASNSLILGRMREAAEQFEDFLKLFPESERFLDNALSDLAVARFNLEDYPAAITASERLAEERPDSHLLGRTLNIEGDAYSIMAGNLPRSEEAASQKAEWVQASLDAYLSASDAGIAAQASDSGRLDFHRSVAGEAIWKATDTYYEMGEIEKGLGQYDRFFPDYAGTFWEPQISVFSLEHLEAAGRGLEGLEQVEKMILFLGNKPPEEQDLTLLRQAIGSYADASVRIRGLEETLAILDDFPGIDPSNQGLLTWMKIQQVIVLQEAQQAMAKDSPEYAAAQSKIAAVFEDLRLFEKRNLSEFALREVGRYFAGTDNPFLAVPYFEELLARTNPEADQFKGLAEMELGLIEMRAADPGQIQSARERFRRIIDQYQDSALVPDAYLNLAKLHIRNEEWRDAFAALDVINKEKNYFRNDRNKRAEAGFLLGTVLDEMGQPKEANLAYLGVVSAYGNFADWITQAWERYIPNSLADFERMPTNTPEEIAAKRQRELALYRLARRYLYQWQNFTDEDAPSGALRRLRRDIEEMKTELRITPEEERAVLFELGITPEN